MTMDAVWQRPRSIERLDFVAVVEPGRWVFVDAGYVWLVPGAVVVLDGVLRLDGVLKVCGDA